MSKECGIHEVHRTFKPSFDATRGYVTLVMSSVTPAQALRPTIRIIASMGLGLQANAECFIHIVTNLHSLLGTVTLVNCGYIRENLVEAEFVVRAESKSWPELVNTLCPRDPKSLQRLDEQFYLPMAA